MARICGRVISSEMVVVCRMAQEDTPGGVLRVGGWGKDEGEGALVSFLRAPNSGDVLVRV